MYLRKATHFYACHWANCEGLHIKINAWSFLAAAFLLDVQRVVPDRLAGKKDLGITIVNKASLVHH